MQEEQDIQSNEEGQKQKREIRMDRLVYPSKQKVQDKVAEDLKCFIFCTSLTDNSTADFLKTAVCKSFECK